jgi:hypothetical protein
MVNANIQIQLLDKNAGYLDVLNDTAVPVNFSVADIRDITKRTGSFSKTIVLAGTKNNAHMLSHYYDLNLTTGLFDVNRIQRCNIVQNGVLIISEAILQLVSVNKIQNNLTEDDEITYEVLVKDSVGDFFSTISVGDLTDIELPTNSHVFDAAAIQASFSHDVNDIYKYVVPWTDNPVVPIKATFPAIYAKHYFDKIHENAGYNYVWGDLNSRENRFDKLLIPYNGDTKKLSEQYIVDNKVVVANTNSVDYDESMPIGIGAWSRFTKHNINPPQEILDPNGEYNPATFIFQSALNIYPPDKLNVTVEYDFDFIVKNNEASNVWLGSILSGQNAFVDAMFGVKNISNFTIVGEGFARFTTLIITPTAATIANGGTNGDIPQAALILKTNHQYAPGETQVAEGKTSITFPISYFSSTDQLKFAFYNGALSGIFKFVSGAGIPDVEQIFRINSYKITVAPAVENSLLLGAPVDLNLFIPQQIKQSDFLKSICTMYNLYVEQDPNDQYRLIYKKRDQFYDEGRTVDWTEKMDRSQEQSLQFLPELTNKKIKLTYRYDQGDELSKAYTSETKEVYGQLEYTFPNEYVRGVDTKELIFAPTINTETIYKQVAPVFSTDKFSPSTTIRILYDGGNLPCDNWVLENYSFAPTNITLSTYPYTAHFDTPYNPTFDLNFGICDYYGYQLNSITNNNLFYKNWIRTITNIETGKMLTAYFWLTEADINQLRLSDKVRIDNGYYYINRVVDYNAGTYQLTKVELISVEDAANIGISTPGQMRPYDVKDVITSGNLGGGAILSGRDLKDIIKVQNNTALGSNLGSAVIGNSSGYVLLGRNVQATEGFNGVVVGSNAMASDPGFYVGDVRLTTNGLQFIGAMIIDAGQDQVMNLNKTSEADFLDAGIDTVRQWGGISNARPFIDAGKIN